MRVLVLGANLAGLLSAMQLHRQGDEISILVHEQEAALTPLPPMVFTDPGPWGSRQSVWATLSGLLHGSGDFRLGLDGLARLPWLIRCLQHRMGVRERNQSLRALALARRSKLTYDELLTTACLLPPSASLPQVTIYDRSQAAKAHYQRGPVWHMGSSRPTLSLLSEQIELLPAMNLAWARQKPTLTSGGMMVSDATQVLSALREHLSDLGVRFIYDRTISGVEHIGKHLHGVSLRGPQDLVEEVDTDVVVAASLPAAWPVLKALGQLPDLARVKSLCMRARVAVSSSTPIYLHDKQRGIRLIRQGSEVWARGPTWFGEPRGGEASEVAQLTAEVARYFGPKCTPVGEVPLVQTSWVAPDGLPVISRTSTRNLFLNLGHHSATATLAFGAAALLQTLIDQALNINRPVVMAQRWSLNPNPLAGHSRGQIHE